MTTSNIIRPARIGCLALAFASLGASQWRTGYFLPNNASGQTVASIPWSDYTHVVQYAVMPTFKNGICGLDTSSGSIEVSSIKDFVTYAHAAGVKAIIGVSQDADRAAILACTTPQNIATFVTLISAFVATNQYDGVDIEWGDDVAPTQYRDLVSGLRTALPSATLSAPFREADTGLIGLLEPYLDQINVMTRGLDIYAIAPLRGNGVRNASSARSQDTSVDGQDSASLYILARRVSSPAKVGLGIPFYGRVSQGCLEPSGALGVTNINQVSLHGVNSRFLSYSDLVSSPYWSLGEHVWDDSRQSQYVSYGGGSCATDALVQYTGPEQMSALIAEVSKNRLGGIMTFGLPYEYLPSQEGNARYPLSTSVARAFADVASDPLLSQAKALKSSETGAMRPSFLPTTPSMSAGLVFTYYVDSMKGSDSNPGTQAAPWKTVSMVNSIALRPGQSVGFLRGGIWRESLAIKGTGTALAPIVMGAYGTGASPVITGSNLITSGWSRDSQLVWKAPVSVRPNIVYFNGLRGTIVANKTQITSEFQWCWTAGILYLWSPLDTNPGQYYMTPGVEAGARDRVVDTLNNSYLTFDGLTFRDANGLGDNQVNVGSASATGIVFQNCTVERGAAKGFELKGATAAGTLSINNCIIRNNAGWGILVDYEYRNLIINDNTITNNGWGSVRDNQEYSGIEGQLGNAHIFRNVIYGNAPVCNVEGTCHGVYGAASSSPSEIYQNTIYGHVHGYGIKTRGSSNIYQNTIHDNFDSGIDLGGNGAMSINVTVSFNVIYNEGNGGIMEASKGAGTLIANLYNNTLYKNAGPSGQEITIADNVSVLSILNNCIFTTDSRRTIALLTAQNGIVTIDYNLHWRVDGNSNISYGGKNKTWTQWQALGFDLHGFNRNALFSNAPAGDFTLQQGSPAVATGVPIGGSTASPNIGAFQ